MSLELTEIPDHVPLPDGPPVEPPPSAPEATLGDINFCLRYQSYLFSFKLPVPVDNIANLYQFHSSIRDRLSASGRYRSNELQLNLWPLITSFHSATAIGPSRAGKTTAYVLALLNKFTLGGYIQKGMTADQMTSKSTPTFQPQRIFGSKIYAIILADSMLSVVSIANEFFKWLRILIGLPPKAEVEVTDSPGTFTEHDADPLSDRRTFRQTHAQRNQYSIRINQLHEKSHMTDYFDVVNGCAVLVTTAGALAKLIRLNLLSLNDNKVLIIDHADEFINGTNADVVDLFALTGLPKTDFVTNRQTMLFAENWTDDIKRFFFEVQEKPVLLLSSLVDATLLFRQAWANIQLIPSGQTSADKSGERVEQILLQLNERPAQSHPVIAAAICKDYEQIKSVAMYLIGSNRIDRDLLKVFFVKESATSIEISRISSQLAAYEPNRRLVRLLLLTTDDIFNFALSYRKFNCLLHLDRFESADTKAVLNYRLLLVFDNLIGAYGPAGSEEAFQLEQMKTLRGDEESKSRQDLIRNYFLLFQDDYSTKDGRFKSVVTSLLEYADQLMSETIGDDGARPYMNAQLLSYVTEDIESTICPVYAAFAKCRSMDKGIHCWKGRHTLQSDKEETGQSKVEANSQIKFRISHVVDSNQFFVQLLAYRSASQLTEEWIPTDDHLQLDKLKLLLLRYKQTNYLQKLKVIHPLLLGGLYALYDRTMLRVRLLKIHPLSGSEELPVWLSMHRAAKMTDEALQFFKLTIDVLAIDVGRTITTRAFNLIAFDATDTEGTPLLTGGIPPLAYRVYLADIVPPDGEYAWQSAGSRANLASITTDTFLLALNASSEENSLTGWILAHTGDTLWMNNVILFKRLAALGTTANINLSENMIRQGVAVANERLYPGLVYNVNRRVITFWQSNIQRKLVNFECFEEGNQQSVYVTKFLSFEEVFVIREDKVEKLQRLETQWAAELERKLKLDKARNTRFTEVILHRGQLCLHLVKNRSQSGEDAQLQVEGKRCQIVAKTGHHYTVVFLDYGFEQADIPFDSLWPLTDEQIASLPFQAIRLNLNVNATNTIYEFTQKGRQAAGLIAENLEKLPALVQFELTPPQVTPGSQVMASLTIESCLQFARHYGGLLFLSVDHLNQFQWSCDESTSLGEREQSLQEESILLVAFLMEKTLVRRTDNYQSLLETRPSYQETVEEAEPVDSDGDDAVYDLDVHENPQSLDLLFQKLYFLYEKPLAVDKSHLDEKDDETEEKAKVKKTTTKKKQETTAGDSEEEWEVIHDPALNDVDFLAKMMVNVDPEVAKDLLLCLGDKEEEILVEGEEEAKANDQVIPEVVHDQFEDAGEEDEDIDGDKPALKPERRPKERRVWNLNNQEWSVGDYEKLAFDLM